MKAPFLSLAFVAVVLTSVAHSESARDALSALPAGEAQALVRVEAHNGMPAPKQWYFIVFDASIANGVREYVVADRRLVSARSGSYLVESATAGEVIGTVALNADSADVAQVALTHARSKGMEVYGLNFRLRKELPLPVPVWTVTCLDAKSAPLGTVSISSDDGKLIASSGFQAPVAESAMPAPPARDGGTVGPIDPSVIASDRQYLAATPPEAIGEEATGRMQRSKPMTRQPQRWVRAPEEAWVGSPRSGEFPFEGFNPAVDAAEDEEVWVEREPARVTRKRRVVVDPDPERAIRRATAPVRGFLRRVIPF